VEALYAETVRLAASASSSRERCQSARDVPGIPLTMANGVGDTGVESAQRGGVAAERDPMDRLGPDGPSRSEEDHPVSEFANPLRGALSPFGEMGFPVESVPYDHLKTERNE